MTSFNDWMWSVVNGAGWWWFGPCVVIAAKNLLMLANMSAPTTTLGRIARTLAWLAHIPMIFVPMYNALGCVALPLLLLANNAFYLQLWLNCREQRKIGMANPKFAARRVLDAMVAKE